MHYPKKKQTLKTGYLGNECRNSHIARIKELVAMDERNMTYTDKRAVSKYLIEYAELLEKENKLNA